MSHSTFRISPGIGAGGTRGSSVNVRRTGGLPTEKGVEIEVRVVDGLTALAHQREQLDRDGFVQVLGANPMEVLRSNVTLELNAGQGAEPSSVRTVEEAMLVRSLYVYELPMTSPRQFVCLELPVNHTDRAYDSQGSAPGLS